MNLRKRLERVMVAITFAEAGEWETAEAFLRKQTRKKRKKVRPTRVTDREDKRPSLRV